MKKPKPKQPGSQSSGPEPLTRADLRAISDEIAYEFPLTGEQSGVVLMDVDPYRLHAYWSLLPENLERARADFAAGGQKAHLVLRFYAFPGQETAAQPSGALPLEAFDQELRDARGHVEVQVRGNGERYEAELGLTADDGGWKSLARSNRVRMPSAGPSPEPGMETLNIAGAPLPAEVAEIGGNPLAADAPEGLPMADDPSLRGGPADKLEPEFPNPAPPEQEPQAPAAEVRQLRPDVPPAPDRYFEADELPDSVAASRLFSSAVLGSSTSSSPALGSSALGELEIHAELHVYGRARPGRELLLFGQPIPLAPDGSFDVRRELDPRNLLLPFTG